MEKGITFKLREVKIMDKSRSRRKVTLEGKLAYFLMATIMVLSLGSNGYSFQPSFGVGVIGANAVDNASGTQGSTTAAGGELEVKFKDSPLGLKTQLMLGNQSAKELNLFLLYDMARVGSFVPYVGLGYSRLARTTSSMGWVVGVDYFMTPAFKMGLFYNDTPTNANQIGISMGYRFNTGRQDTSMEPATSGATNNSPVAGAITPTSDTAAVPEVLQTKVAIASPVIFAISPANRRQGSTVTITGDGFETGSIVMFDNSVQANVISVSPNQITVVVPTGISIRKHSIIVITAGNLSNSIEYTD